MSNKQYFVLFIVAVVMMLMGSSLGVNHYKRSCEPMSRTQYRVEWLECKP